MLQVVELSSLGKWESREKKKEGRAKELAEGLDTLPGGSSWSPRPSRLSSGGRMWSEHGGHWMGAPVGEHGHGKVQGPEAWLHSKISLLFTGSFSRCCKSG